MEFKTIYDLIDPRIKELDEALRRKEEVKWKLHNKYGTGQKAGKGGRSAAGRSPANE